VKYDAITGAAAADNLREAAVPAPEPTPPSITSLSDHDVVVGYGRVGGLVGAQRRRDGAPETASAARDQRVPSCQDHSERPPAALNIF